jgi:hypothetical protein
MKFPKLRKVPKYIRALLVVAVCGAAGTYFLVTSHASTPTASVEAESGTVSSAASTVTDSTASANSAVKFGSASAAGTTCTVGQTGGTGNCIAPPAGAASGKQWKVTFADDFNASSLDTTKWTPCFDWNSGDCTATFNQGYEYYEPSAVSLSGGLAHLHATPLANTSNPPGCGITVTTKCSDGACYNGTCLYKSGLMSTARKLQTDPSTAYLYKFTYGYVEASLQVPSTQGFFIAWWMLPADPTFNYTYTPSGTPVSGTNNPPSSFRYEIDILEELGHDPTDMEMHYSWGDGANYYSPNDSGGNGACSTQNYGTGQHRFGVDWEPSFVAFYIDGVKCGQHNATSGAPSPNVPMQLIMDQMVSNNWMRSIGKPLLNTSLSNDVPVDYVHVYQQQ